MNDYCIHGFLGYIYLLFLNSSENHPIDFVSAFCSRKSNLKLLGLVICRETLGKRKWPLDHHVQCKSSSFLWAPSFLSCKMGIITPFPPTSWEARCDGPHNRALECHGQLGRLYSSHLSSSKWPCVGKHLYCVPALLMGPNTQQKQP